MATIMLIYNLTIMLAHLFAFFHYLALHIAGELGDERLFQRLVSAGGDVSIRNQAGAQPDLNAAAKTSVPAAAAAPAAITISSSTTSLPPVSDCACTHHTNFSSYPCFSLSSGSAKRLVDAGKPPPCSRPLPLQLLRQQHEKRQPFPRAPPNLHQRPH